MKRIKILPIIVASAAISSCSVDEPIYDTPHPEHGKITLSTAWDDRSENIDIPANYTVKVGDYSTILEGTTNRVDNLFSAGKYDIHIYNTANNIMINGTTATADYSQALGWLFFGTENVNIEKDKDHKVTVAMYQQVRQLTLVIEPKGETSGNIENITASLSGVAGTLDINTQMHGTASNITLNFMKITTGADAGKWSATFRLLGVTGSQQKLSGRITFTGGSPGDIALESDLAAALTNFNADKKNPLTLGGKIVETPSGVGFAGTIINAWQEQGAINGEAGYQ